MYISRCVSSCQSYDRYTILRKYFKKVAYVSLPRSQTSVDELIQLPRIALCNTIVALHVYPRRFAADTRIIQNAIIAVYYHKPCYEISQSPRGPTTYVHTGGIWLSYR